MSIAILGSNGFIGSNLLELIPNSIGITKENYYTLRGSHYDTFINAAGNSDKRLPETDPILDFNLSVRDVLHSITDFSFDNYIYLSSCEVYGSLSEDTNEEREINPAYISKYGLSKYLAECIVKRYCQKYLILRLNGVVGQNMKKGVIYDILNGDKLWVSKDSRFQFINTKQIAKFISSITKWNKTYNLTGNFPVSIKDVIETLGREIESPKKPTIIHNIDNKKANKVLKLWSSMESIERIMHENYT